MTDITKGEQMAPEFIAMNPHHTVPTLKVSPLLSLRVVYGVGVCVGVCVGVVWVGVQPCDGMRVGMSL